MIKVLFAGGGSGGHVYPILAVLDELAAMRDEDFKLYYLGPKSPYDDEFRERDVALRYLASAKMRRYFSALNFLDAVKFPFLLLRALALVFRIMPDVVFSKGGPGALPVIVAARFYLIPVIIHESDSVPGLTNRLSARFAKRIGVSFEETLQFFPKEKAALVGNPVRSTFLAEGFSREHAKQHFGFDEAVAALLFIGGSQGAAEINNFVLENLGEFLPKYQVIHVTGEGNFTESDQLAKFSLKDFGEDEKRRYRWYSYLDMAELRFAYVAADVVVSRAGSGSIFEIAAFGRASILVPLEGAAQDHQKKNAYAYAKTGAAVVVERDNFTPHIVELKARDIISTPGAREKMESAARAFARPNAARVVAEEIVRIARRK